MAILYCRMRKLTNVLGKRTYISSSKRQENLEGFYDTISREDWKALGKENREQFRAMQKKGIMKGLKNSKGEPAKCIEAREVIIDMPHDLALKMKPEDLAKALALLIKNKYGVECCVAIHWNEGKSNYHAHIIMSEKTRLKEPWIATRNMYYDENWKRCKKDDAVHIVKKGDIVRTWEKKKIKEFKKQEFLQKELKPLLAKTVGLEVYKDDGMHIPTQKYGKLPDELKNRIIEANNRVHEWNLAMDYLLEQGVDKEELQRFRHLCFNMSKKEWRDESLTDGLSKLKNNYVTSENAFVELWKLYLEVERKKKEKKDAENELAKKETEKVGYSTSIEMEKNKPFFQRNRELISSVKKKIKQVETETKKIKEKINKLQNVSSDWNDIVEKFRRSKCRKWLFYEKNYINEPNPSYNELKEAYEKDLKKEQDFNTQIKETPKMHSYEAHTKDIEVEDKIKTKNNHEMER